MPFQLLVAGWGMVLPSCEGYDLTSDLLRKVWPAVDQVDKVGVYLVMIQVIVGVRGVVGLRGGFLQRKRPMERPTAFLVCCNFFFFQGLAVLLQVTHNPLAEGLNPSGPSRFFCERNGFCSTFRGI
jgi:hypothetical protein